MNGAAEAIAPPAAVLAAHAVSKSYGAVDALIDATVALRSGEIVGLVGDNGAGKSTLVKILSGVHAPDEGWVEVSGVPTEFRSTAEAHRHGIETIYQDLALAPDLTAEENLYLGRELLRGRSLFGFGFLRAREMRKECAGALRELGIHLPNRRIPVASLSGGQRQAVAAARLVHWARRVAILDEPTAALGVRQSRIVMNTIMKIAESGLAVMVVTHDLPRLLEIADRIVVMRLGRIIAERPSEAFSVASLAAVIMGADAHGDSP